jgi:hypothetical protein
MTALGAAVGVSSLISTGNLRTEPLVERAEAATASDIMSASGPISVTAVDYAFEGVPERVTAGTTFSLVNDSDVEVHELIAMRIADGESRTVGELLQLPEEELVGVVEEQPTMVLVALPRSEGRAVLGDGIVREPGRYALLCFIPTGADPQAYLAAAMAATDGPPQVAGGPPHFVRGMFAEVVVD